jgi:hypothetical protein
MGGMAGRERMQRYALERDRELSKPRSEDDLVLYELSSAVSQRLATTRDSVGRLEAKTSCSSWPPIGVMRSKLA